MVQVTELPKAASEVPTFLSVQKAAEILNLKPMLLYKYIWDKKGPRTVRFGRLIRIRLDDLLTWATPGKTHPPMNPKKD